MLLVLDQRPLNGTLLEIETFLAANPTEVVTIFFEDYVNITNGITNALTDAGLSKYSFPLAKMPTDGSDWPTVSSMITSNERLLIFTSDKNKQSTEGIAYQWNYVVENQCKWTNFSFLEFGFRGRKSEISVSTTNSLMQFSIHKLMLE